MDKLPVNFPSSMPFTVPGLDTLGPSTVKAIFIVAIVFFVVVSMAIGRRYLVSSSLRGVWAGFVMGIMGVLVIEAVVFWVTKSYVFGNKATALPKNIRIVLDDSRQNINQVLGVETERKTPTAQSVVFDYSSLPPFDSDLARNSICQPVATKSGSIR